MLTAQWDDGLISRGVEILHRELGLRPDPAMLSRLRRCLRDEAGDRQLDPAAYLSTLAAEPQARQRLFDRITVQETSFFRHPGQFEALARHILPHLAGPVSIWSAACANGQEAYSLAMVLDEQGRGGTVIASDVSTRALQRTADARYQTRELNGLSAARRARHLVGGPDDWQIRRAIRDRVSVRHHNLVTDAIPEPMARCQVVFCRNVLIYFSPDQATAFLARLASQLALGTYLFLGYAETIWQVSDLFEPVRIGEAFEYYVRRARPGPVRQGDSASWRPGGFASGPRRLSARPSTHPHGPAARVRPTATIPAPAGGPSISAPAGLAEDLARSGQAAAAGGDFPAAISAFRKCVYLTPDAPLAYLHLGFALEASGDKVSAVRSFRAARAALTRSEPSDLAAALGGYQVEALMRLLDSKQEDGSP